MTREHQAIKQLQLANGDLAGVIESMRSENMTLRARLRNLMPKTVKRSRKLATEESRILWAAGSIAMTCELFLSDEELQTPLNKSVDPMDAGARYLTRYTHLQAIVVEVFQQLEKFKLGEAFESDDRRDSLVKRVCYLTAIVDFST
jgi:hypothetical protein